MTDFTSPRPWKHNHTSAHDYIVDANGATIADFGSEEDAALVVRLVNDVAEAHFFLASAAALEPRCLLPDSAEAVERLARALHRQTYGHKAGDPNYAQGCEGASGGELKAARAIVDALRTDAAERGGGDG